MTSLGGSARRRGLTDIIPQYDDSQSNKSQISTGSGDSDQRNNSIKIQHLTGSSALGRSRFPKLEECAHFHYEHVELNSLQLSLYEEEDLKSLSSLEYNENTENKWLTVKITSQGQSWLLRRTYENFRMLDQQLHQCIYDRKFSSLPELPPLENLQEKQDPQTYLKCQLSKYCERFSDIAGSLINCGPVLNWLQIDNRGRRILVTDGDSCPINTPAVAAAYAVQKYTAVASDEISFEVGDMISVIDMPPPEDSIWWRGKRGFMVGFFPSHCVAIITDKVPRNLQLHQPSSTIEPSKPVLRKHGKLIAFFRAFILSRPSKRHLKQTGIFKERVFGCDLGEHLSNSGQEVPMVLKCCSEFIEQHGIVDGIYRLSGATTNIQKLRTTFDEDRIPALYHDDSILQDIHSVASLLKMYFRELPNPLCTYQLYKQFVNAVQNADPTERVTLMREVVQKLPPPHFRTLEYLMRHLSKVAEHGTRTGMTARNIAIVWAPNLLRCKELEVGGVAALQGVGVQAVVTEFLISNVDLVFCKDQISSQGISRRVRPKSLSLGTPTKLLSLEEAQSKKLGSEHSHDNSYIEVGGGPACLPKIYHTVIELPSRKRLQLKRSPLGWKSFFSRGGSGSTGLRKSSSSISSKRKPPAIDVSYKNVESSKKIDCEVKTRLRTVKSAESLMSGVNGASVRNSVCLDYLPPPSPKLSGTGHSRSVSHDSYFDHLAESTPIHSAIHKDEEGLSDLQVNFDFDESEMKIFSEESSQLFSNTSSSEQLQQHLKKVPVLASAENTLIVDPSPKKHKNSDCSSCSSATLSDDMTAVSNKRSRLEEQLIPEDLAYIDSLPHNDRVNLVVEVDVHHRESSQISSPMNETVCSDNDTVLSGCTMSDSTMANVNVSYTPLSECSHTTSSNREPSYQLLLSESSMQLPKSSNESIKNCDCRKYENVPRNRYSYQGDLRSSLSNGNRLSLQTLSSGLVVNCHRSGHIKSSLSPVECREEKSDPRELHNVNTLNAPSKCDPFDRYTYSKETYSGEDLTEENEDNVRVPVVPENRLEWQADRTKSHPSSSNSSNGSTESEQNSEYENVQKLELILNDKDMFSDSKKCLCNLSSNESPYELVTVVGNRMTYVPTTNDNQVFVPGGSRRDTCPVESNYEEIEPSCPTRCPTDSKISDVGANSDNYEEMSSVYADNDIYNFEGSLVESEKKSSYEDICIVENDHSNVKCCLSSSNESLESSTDEAMIENNLYECLTGEDSSPDPASNRSSKIINNEITATSAQNEVRNNYKNFVETLEVSTNNCRELTANERSPLLISDTHSPYSDCEQPLFCVDARTNNATNSSEQITDDDDVDRSKSCFDDNNVFSSPEGANHTLEPSEAVRPNSLPLKGEENVYKERVHDQPDSENKPRTAKCDLVESKPRRPADDEKSRPDLLRSGSTKSVQDLVCRFEWSAENELPSAARKESAAATCKNKGATSSGPDKKEYFSLPPVLIRRKSSQDSLASVVESSGGDEKVDESIRRDRIEKYKEERRLALRQKYHRVDENVNEQKDEEMIRRFKQKLLKNEKADGKSRSEYDASPSEERRVKNDFSPTRETAAKPPPAVTTINILYTSRRRKDSADVDDCVEKRISNDGGDDGGGISSETPPNTGSVARGANRMHFLTERNHGTSSPMSKSYSNVSDKLHESLKANTSYDERRPFTSSLERRTNKVKSFVKEESLVAKRVNQLSEASELYSSSSNRRGGEFGSMRQRAHSASASGPVVPYCIRDIAAIFENKDNKQ